MDISSNGLELLKRFEGLRLESYQDSAGYWTIGYGHSEKAPSVAQYPVGPGQTITEDQASDMLKADLQPTVDDVNSLVTREITQNQFDALVSFTYNLGSEALRTSDVLSYTNSGAYQQAADAMMQYVHAGGVVLEGLQNRRQEEKDLYLSSAPASTPDDSHAVEQDTKRINTLIGWFEERKGKVTYSMDNRMGPSSYDCSSSVYLALASAGYLPSGSMGNTDTLFGDLENHGWSPVPPTNDSYDTQRGDIFIWGIRGQSTGAFGHTGVFYDDNDSIIHCNGGYNGITINDHDTIWIANGQPPVAIYRYTESGVDLPQPDDGVAQLPDNTDTSTKGKLQPYAGSFTPDRRLPVSKDTDPNSPEVAFYDAGMTVLYDSYIFENGYAWISYVSYAGERRYIAVGPDDGRTDTVWGTGFLNNVPSSPGALTGLTPKSGVFIPNIQLPVSNDTDPNSPAVAYYAPGQAIAYDSYIIANGYAWISYISYSGTRRYIAVGPSNGGSNSWYGSGFYSPASHNVSQNEPTPPQLYQKYGAFIPNQKLPVSKDTDPNSPEVAFYDAGMTVYYDSYIIENGYVWISYMSDSGTRRYIAVGPADGNAANTWGTGFFN